MVCPGKRANPFNKDDEVHSWPKLESLHKESFGDVVELQNGNGLP